MATGSLKELEKEIICAICQEHYTDPKVLPCLHYYCKKCIHDLAFRTGTAKPFPCPECRNETLLPTEENLEELRPAFFINRFKTTLLSALERSQDKDEVTCEVCHDGASKAEGFCLQCEAFICVACMDLHKGLKEYDGHKVLSMKELLHKGLSQVTVSQCKVHEEPLKLYCFTCSSLICRDCIVKDHKEHEYEFITVVAPDARKKIADKVPHLEEAEAMLDETSERVKAAIVEVKHQGDAVKTAMEAYFEDLYRILDARKHELMDGTERIVQEKVGKLSQQEEAVSLAAGDIGGLAGQAARCSVSCSDSNVVSMHEELLSQIELTTKKLSAGEWIDLVEELDIGVELECAESLQQLCRTMTNVAPLRVDATKCEVLYDEAETIKVGNLQEVALITKLSNGRLTKSTCKIFCQLKCLRTDEVTTCDIMHNMEASRYSIRFIPTFRGRHTLTVLVDGHQVAGSPFPLFVAIHPTHLGKPVGIWTGIAQVTGITVNSTGEIIVTEESGDIIIFNSKGEKVRSIKHSDHQLKSTYDLAVDGEDKIYCADYCSNKIFTCDKDGSNIKISEVALKKSLGRRGLSVVKDEVFICEQETVMVYDKRLTCTREIADKNLGSARCVSPGRDGILYVTDRPNSAIQVFKNGRFLNTINCIPNPLALCVAGSYIYVTDYTKCNVSVFETNGVFVTSFGQHGSGRGSFILPHGICVDQDGFVYVADRSNNRVQVF